jgi:Glycosyl transferase 4-like domain
MTIFFLIRSLAIGCAERQLGNLARGLARLGHAVSVLTLYEDGWFASDVVESGVVVRSLGKSTRWDLARPICRLVTMIRSERPDVLHGYLTAGNLLAGLAVESRHVV